MKPASWILWHHEWSELLLSQILDLNQFRCCTGLFSSKSHIGSKVDMICQPSNYLSSKLKKLTSVRSLRAKRCVSKWDSEEKSSAVHVRTHTHTHKHTQSNAKVDSLCRKPKLPVWSVAEAQGSVNVITLFHQQCDEFQQESAWAYWPSKREKKQPCRNPN